MRFLRNILAFLTAVLVVLFVTYQIGPRPAPFNLPAASKNEAKLVPALNEIETYVRQDKIKNQLKPGNQSQLYWADSLHQPTAYVILYLHGFSASPEEGSPVHTDIAKQYGMNLYAPRLAAHGLDEKENMLEFTAEKYVESAQEALAVAQQLGEKVILMSASTGSTAALYLASAPENNIAGLICYSPNIQVFDPRASLLAGPWGLQIARLVKGSPYQTWEAPKGAEQFWHTQYRLEATVELQRLLEGTMKKEVFEKVTAPILVGAYYKNEEEQDDVVSVAAMREMYTNLGSKQKQFVEFPNAGAHCMPSNYFGQDIEGLKKHTNAFIEETFAILPAVSKVRLEENHID